LAQVLRECRLQPADVARVVTHVHQGALDVLGPVVDPVTVHQSKFSMGTVLALVARFGHAGLPEFEHHFRDPETLALRDKVHMVLDAEVDAAYPRRWIGKVSVETVDGRTLHGRVDEPKGDPGNTLDRAELTAKALQLAAFSGGASAAEMGGVIERLWRVAQWDRVEALLPCSS
jgi:2-methylcitrate dehydratase PrpD